MVLILGGQAMRAMGMSWMMVAWMVAALASGCGGGSHGAGGGGQATATPTVTPTVTCPLPETTPTDAEQFGAIAPSAVDLAAGAACLPPAALSTPGGSPTPPPSAMIPISALPPVQAQGTAQMQGSPGSCEIWSAGYAMGSYTANLTNQQPISDLANTVSAGFLYPYVLNEESETCGSGTKASDTLNYLVAHTAPSLAAVPYSPSCACLAMVDINQSYSTDLTIGSWCYLPSTGGPDTLELIKGWVAQGHVVQTSIFVPWEFGNYTSGVYSVPASCPTPPPTTKPFCTEMNGLACIASDTTTSGCAQHGVAVIGYDDAMVGPNGELGAVQIMNSFGPAWGENGFMWMTYDSLNEIYFAGTVAFPPQPSGGLGGSSTIVDAFQRVEPGAGAMPAAHLIVEVAFAEPLPDTEVVITAPEQRTVRHHFAQPLRHGYVYLTRRDGNQFEAGTYRIEVRGSSGGTVQGEVTVGLDPASTLPTAPLPTELTGTNGQPVAFDP